MTSSVQHRDWISRPGLRVASGALAVAVGLELGIGAIQPAHGQTYREKVLYTFTGTTDGEYPYAGLVRDAKGNLYGTTQGRGDPYCVFPDTGCGTVFTVSSSGTETLLYSFTIRSAGAFPDAGLVRDHMGNLYGTTFFTTWRRRGLCCGTVFKLDPTGKETALYIFNVTDGAYPAGALVRDANGNLYGTTFEGGDSTSCPDQTYRCGTVFKLDPTGKETVLHSFNGADGEYPYAGLVQDAKGNLYGTTSEGGDYGYGTVFEVDPTGKETVLYSFAHKEYPHAGLIRDATGNLYGTTVGGGSHGYGTVFKVDPTGKETVLHSFTGTSDGGNPYASLIRDANGNLYGTTVAGGSHGYGTVFKVSKTGKEVVLHSFNGADGKYPYASLVADKNGKFYGTTSKGGASDDGVVFKLTP